MPFGSNPVIGSSFYIGYDEIIAEEDGFSKFQFSFKVNWLDAPQKFFDYYNYYSKHFSIS